MTLAQKCQEARERGLYDYDHDRAFCGEMLEYRSDCSICLAYWNAYNTGE
jgi:hypothetical protein